MIREGWKNRSRFLTVVLVGVMVALMVMTSFTYCLAETEENPKNQNTVNLTSEEKEYLRQNPRISIAIDTSWMPYGFQDKAGNCDGIIPNVLNMVAQRTGLNVDYIAKNSYADTISACNSGDTTLVSGIASLSENDINQAIYNGASNASSTTYRFMDMIYSRPAIVAGIGGTLVAMIAVIVFLIVFQRRKVREITKQREYEKNIHRKDETQQQLQESADIVRAAMHSANISIWRYDLESHSISQKYDSESQHGFGKLVENVPERLIESGYVHPNSAEAYRKAFNDIAHATQPIEGDYLVKTPDKTAYWWERMILTPILDNGKVVKVIGTSLNVTASKEKENKYIKLIDNMTDANEEELIAKGRYNLSRNSIVYYRRKSEDSLELPASCTFDYAMEQMVNTAEDPEDGKKIRKLLNRENLIENYSSGKYEGSYEYRRYNENGTIIWSLLKFNVFEEPNNGEIMFFVYTYDISERVMENRILTKLSAAEYEALSIMDIATHRFTVKNIAAEIEGAVFNMEGNYDEVVKRRIAEVVVAEERDALMQQFDVENIVRELEDKDKFNILYSVMDNQGQLRRKKYQFCYLDDTKSTLLYYRTDETEAYNREQQQLIRTEYALRQARFASEAKTEFFSRMSHDMRTPMNGILGLARLSADESDPVVLRENLKKIQFSGEYLLGLINDTLDFQKIENGRMVLEPKPVSTKEVVENVITMVKPTADQKGVNFHMTVKNADIDSYVNIDSIRMKQIFMNLISNAIKFTPAGGTVEVCFECIGHDGPIAHDVITISDTGIGMSKEFLENGIFKPFSQEYNEVTASNAGSGLGLSIVKKLVELMNGSVEVESEPGVGTKFIVKIDFQRVDDFVAVNKVNGDRPGKLKRLDGKNVLLAEDHPLNAEIAKRLLGKVGCNVTWAKNGQECVESFNSSDINQFDIILMDVRMPILDGIESTKAIRALSRVDAKRIPIVAMTANAYSEDIDNCLKAGMNGHISKPIEPKVMYDTMVSTFINKS